MVRGVGMVWVWVECRLGRVHWMQRWERERESIWHKQWSFGGNTRSASAYVRAVAGRGPVDREKDRDRIDDKTDSKIEQGDR